MANVPDTVSSFLSGRRFAITGVSRSGKQPANAIFKRLKAAGYAVVPVNPSAAEVESQTCHPSVMDVPGSLDGVVIASPPQASIDIVAQCAEKGVEKVWFHRSFGDGSVSEEAVEACHRYGIEATVGGCPMMFCEPVDVAHRCMRWWLQRRGTVPS